MNHQGTPASPQVPQKFQTKGLSSAAAQDPIFLCLVVDPRPFEAALDQAEAILEKDLSRVREAQANRVSNESHLKHAEAILKKDQMTLYLTPVVYIYLDRFQKKISRKGSIFRVKSAKRVEEQAGAREAGYH